MAMTIDNRLYLQPTDEITWDADGVETLTLEWKGPYAACKATAGTAKRGDEIPTVAGGNAYTPDSEFYAGLMYAHIHFCAEAETLFIVAFLTSTIAKNVFFSFAL